MNETVKSSLTMVYGRFNWKLLIESVLVNLKLCVPLVDHSVEQVPVIDFNTNSSILLDKSPPDHTLFEKRLFLSFTEFYLFSDELL